MGLGVALPSAVLLILAADIYNFGSPTPNPASGHVIPILRSHGGKYSVTHIVYVTAHESLFSAVAAIVCVSVGVVSIGVAMLLKKRST